MIEMKKRPVAVEVSIFWCVPKVYFWHFTKKMRGFENDSNS